MAGRSTIILAFFLTVSTTPVGAEVGGILQRYLEAIGRVEYAAVVSREARQADAQLVGVLAEVREKDGKELFKIVAGPSFHKGTISVEDGERLLIYLPAEKRCYRYTAPTERGRQQRQEEVRRLIQHFDARLVGTQSIAGRDCHQIEFRPKGRWGLTLNVWIDQQQFIALKQEAVADKRLLRRIECRKIRFNPGLSDDDFRFTPPAGTEIFEVGARETGDRPPPFTLSSGSELRAAVGIRAMKPNWVPDGYRLAHYFVAPPAPGQFLQRRIGVTFTNGDKVLMLHQGGLMMGSHRGGSEGRPVEVQPNALFWQKNDVRLFLIGPRDMDRGDLKRCAGSVDWYDAGTDREGAATLLEPQAEFVGELPWWG